MAGFILDFEILTLFSNLPVARMAGPVFNDTGDFALIEGTEGSSKENT